MVYLVPIAASHLSWRASLSSWTMVEVELLPPTFSCNIEHSSWTFGTLLLNTEAEAAAVGKTGCFSDLDNGLPRAK